MRLIASIVFFLISLLIISGYANAALTLKNPIPEDGSYIYGRNSDTFSVEITGENLNTSNVTLNYKVEGPSTWGEQLLNCDEISSNDWVCYSNIPGIESLLADGKKLLYYFEASDTNGAVYNLGDVNNPLSVLVDRSVPYIEEINVEKESWVGKNYAITAKIKDKYSGVKSVKFFYGNDVWNSTEENCEKIGEEDYKIPWNVSSLGDGSLWNLYIVLSDNVGNENTTVIKNIRIDNENPKIISTYPVNGSGLFDFVKLDLNASDSYSGISKAYYYLGGFYSSMSCSNNECSVTISTRDYPDDSYELSFVVYDNANNTAKVSMNITIDNTNPTISLVSPTKFYIHKTTLFKIDVGNAKSVKKSTLELGGKIYGFSCVNTTCEVSVDTTEFPDNEYTATIFVTNEVGVTISKVFHVFIDNSNPLVTFSSKYANNTIYVDAAAIDDIGLDPNATIITLYYDDTIKKIKPECNSFVQGKKLVCHAEIFIGNNTTTNYEVSVTFYDFAGNAISKGSTVIPQNYTIINVIEKKETNENIIINETKNQTSPINEYVKKYLTTSLIVFGVILAIIVTLFSILIFTKTKRVIKSITFSIEKNISKETSALQLAVNYLLAASTEEDEISSQMYIMNTSKIIDEIYPGNFILIEMNKLPSSIRESIFEKYGKEFDYLRLKGSEIAKVKSILSDSNISVKDKASKSIEIIKKIIAIDDKELEIWRKIKKEYLGE